MERGEITAKAIRVLILDGSAIHTQLLAEALRRDRALDVISLDSPQAVIKTVAAEIKEAAGAYVQSRDGDSPTLAESSDQQSC